MARKKKSDQEPPPNYRAWKCPSCGEGVEGVEVNELSVITYRLILSGVSGLRWEQVEVEPVEPDDDAEAGEPFYCGHCGEEIKDEIGQVMRSATDFHAYLDDAVIQQEALELLDRLAPAPYEPKGSA